MLPCRCAPLKFEYSAVVQLYVSLVEGLTRLQTLQVGPYGYIGLDWEFLPAQAGDLSCKHSGEFGKVVWPVIEDGAWSAFSGHLH